MSQLNAGLYTIRQSSAPLLPFEVHPLVFKVSHGVAWALWSTYIVGQLWLARKLQQSLHQCLWPVWIIVLAEFFLTFQDAVTALDVLLGLFSTKPVEPRPRYRLTGDTAPAVDVLVTCCGEPVDVVLDTLAAASAQNLPPECVHVFLLDDGQDEELRQSMIGLNNRLAALKRPAVTYLSREKPIGVRSYFKGGNLRFGIEESRRQSNSEFIAGLDADMIPEQDWLAKMVPHLLLDAKMAMACCPQRYYDVTHADPLGQQAEFTMMFEYHEPLNDRLGAVMCTGTGYVARRSALEDIGGWPLASESGEDLMCSTVLGNAGWRIAFIREYLQSGLAPGSMRAMLQQRMRWIDACLEVCQYFGYYLPGNAISSQMPLSLKAVSIIYALRDHSPLTTSLFLLLLPIALLPSNSATTTIVPSEHVDYLSQIQILYAAVYLAQKLNVYIMYNNVGPVRVQNHESHFVWASPYLAYRVLISLLPASLSTTSFFVSGTTSPPENERSHLSRAPRSKRLLTLPILCYILYALFLTTAITLRLRSPAPDTVSLLPLAGAVVKLVNCGFKALVPVRYMLFPPTVPERAELLKEKDESGVRRPQWGWGEQQGVQGNGIWWACCALCEVVVIWWCWR
ncbi:MAG: hypothetical protein LQ350_008405 [Teloschistes chrysophthalmus]|nr:MAG: hypothetical protein LQ350_008405 [Niorma chrysophthalma]